MSPIPSKSAKSGVTLVEVMISFTIFAVVAAGMTATLIQSQRMAYKAVYENAAFNAAQGFLEQMRSMTFSEFEDAYNSGESLPTVSSSPDSALIISDPLTFYTDNSGEYDRSQYDEKSVLIDVVDNQDITMNMRFYLQLRDLSTDAPVGQNNWNAFEIQLNYEFEVPSTSGSNWLSDKLVTVVSKHEI